ncbi:uncharacterized protein N7515_001360 [Penicillium bovifimosum]|uniref:Aminoglycoside phosphotransferase domain-containing protein n=1 Tax=Penicillium bovifimosum TaxID=126998 RepID=A0A9W9H9U3_9EURO|nr:uncharacterized protein N7515_001360 [Penicillium bovifimosum]KAJ5142573.1 hypothetical protein N7515_001360 [Penicillium bovifimosum]
MASSEVPCPACKWTPDQQRRCSYESNVRLFYGAGDRGYWALGSKFIFKDRGIDPPSYEVMNTRFLAEKTTIPVPITVQEWTEGKRYFQIVERVPGVPLDEIWSSIPQPDRERLASQTAGYLNQLRNFHSPKMQSLHGQPLHCAHLFLGDDYGVPHGPLSTAEELWDELAKALENDKIPDAVRSRFRETMPSPLPWTFTHGDLTDCNIIVDPVTFELRSVIDWESSGYFPVWWEFAWASVGLSTEDKEWKDLLRGNMANQEEGRQWYLNYKSFTTNQPWALERRVRFLKECGVEGDIDISK